MSALDKYLFYASLHNKRLKIPLGIQRRHYFLAVKAMTVILPRTIVHTFYNRAVIKELSGNL